MKNSSIICSLIIVAILSFFSCKSKKETERENFIKSICENPEYPQFWGDSTMTLISSNRPNGFLVKIFCSKDLAIINLSRGDSINVYIPISDIPFSLCNGDTIGISHYPYISHFGTYIVEMNIPVTDGFPNGNEWFFMDVNFDGEEDFVIETLGNRRTFYTCFDLLNGDTHTLPGMLSAMNLPPYNHLVYSDCVEETFTKFDFDKKTIYISEQVGCSTHINTWCEMTKDYDWEAPHLEVVKSETVDYYVDGTVVTTISKRIDGELKEIEEKTEPAF